MDKIKKFGVACENLKPGTEFQFLELPTTEEIFNKVEWFTGASDEDGVAIKTLVNPHSELTWAKVTAEMDRLQAISESAAPAEREAAYPPLSEFAEAYTEREIGGDSTKWDAYIVKYNKVKTDYPKS